jgi:hypothetical protein
VEDRSVLPTRLSNTVHAATGGFADIFKAMHKDAAVVIKRLRMRCTDQADPNLEQVRCMHRSQCLARTLT